jgi:DNA-binding NarL/FixJ family response regulator
VTPQDGIAALAGYQADASEPRLAGGRDGDGPGQPLGSQVPQPVFMLMSGRGDPAAPPAPRQAGPSGQKLDPVAAALEVIATSQPAVSRTPSPTRGQGPGVQPGKDPLSALTPREMEVLRRIAEGQNTKNMAREMNVTTETLRTYVRNVLTKLGAHSRLEAAALAVQHVPPARSEPEHDHKLFAALTPREREVLIHLANGSGLREVGKRLHMSPKTLSTHLQNLRNKLGVHSTLEAVALARSRFGHRPHSG